MQAPAEPADLRDMKLRRTAAEAHFFAALARLESGNLAEAEASLREALDLDHDFAEAYGNLGLVLDRQARSLEAEACYRKALALDLSLVRVQTNLGALLAGQRRFQEAEAIYLQAARLDPDSASNWSNLGVLYACMKREAEAERCYRRALYVDENHGGARFNLSYILLRQGRFEEGWSCLEARDWYGGLAARLPCPRWQGEALFGKSLIIGVEAGHGDMIQFCRYAGVLKSEGAGSITLICHPALKSLLRTLESVDRVVGLDEPLPAGNYDYWTPPLSLPFRCGTREDSIPAAIPYLFARPETVARRALELPAHGVRIGLAWKGNPAFENDHDRSLPGLHVLAPLWSVPGAEFVSLQKGAGEIEAASPPAGQPLVAPALADFADTAAVMASLDLVIAVDTAVAHLAGALGKPCWLLLPYYRTDWRWQEGRQDTPWYPGIMRLFRQRAMGEWGAVMAELVSELEFFVVALVRENRGGHENTS
ncbi:MAG: tetratricopeptide repeat protein [Rhodocyclaceae bacterium]|nr:tetratricopeptide repeat protein [Rhodocyclaceae bacterium]